MSRLTDTDTDIVDRLIVLQVAIAFGIFTYLLRNRDAVASDLLSATPPPPPSVMPLAPFPAHHSWGHVANSDADHEPAN